MSRLNLLTRDSPAFPPVNRALDEPNGLLAVGGALDVEWLTAAYRHGIFPWFDEDDGPILWWCPDPRAVIYPDQIRITRSLAKRLRNADFEVTADTAFSRVIAGCAAERRSGGQTATGTWITEDMKRAYTDLHELGLAHSIEVWQAPGAGTVMEAETVHTAGGPAGKQLVGGLYGVSLGNMFFGESMFSRVADASKIALCHLGRQLHDWGFWLIDCQLSNPHLTTMGAVELPRATFIELVEKNAHQPTREGDWTLTTFTDWRRQSRQMLPRQTLSSHKLP